MNQPISRKFWWLIALLVGPTGTTWPADPPATQSFTSGARLAIAGHSFHVEIAPVLEKLAASAGLTNQVLVAALFVGGSSVNQVWEKSATESDVRAALQAGQVDVLTLSPHRNLPDPGLDKFINLGLAGNPHLRVTVQQSWVPYDNAAGLGRDPDPATETPIDWDAMTGAKLSAQQAPYFKELDQQIRALNRRSGRPVVLLVPTGRALIALREKIRLGQVPGLPSQAALFRDRMGHPGPAVTLLNAYCHFAVIYRSSPVGLALRGAVPEIPTADGATLNRILQEIAWATVTTSPLSGVPAVP